MSRSPIWRRYLRFWQPNVEADIDDELRFHLEARGEELVATGISREAAAVQARAEMGDLAAVRSSLAAIDRRTLRRRSHVEQWRVLGMELGYALRRLRGTPMFTLAATLTLAIAIGATASVFSVVDGVLLKSSGVRDPENVLVLFEMNPARHLLQMPTSPANFLDWRAQANAFTALAASSVRPATVTGGPEPERLRVLAVTPNWFGVLGLTAALGRVLTTDSGGPPEVVISYGYWQRRFGGARSVLGRTLMLDDQPYTIVGVMPAHYFGVTDQLWTRLSFTGKDEIGRGNHSVYVYGRLKRGKTVADASLEMETIARRLAQSYPQTNKGWSVETLPVREVQRGFRPALLMLLAAAGCVLLIGAANLANLFLVQCVAREREMAIRTAIGATRARLIRDLIIEATTLALGGGALGVGLAVVGARGLRALAPPWLPRLSEVVVDGRVVAFCALTSIATLLIFGVLPALQAGRGSLTDCLKQGGAATGSAQRSRLQDVLVVVQVAVALVLLTGSGLLVKGFAHFQQFDPGFRSAGVLTAAISSSTERYSTSERQAAFVENVLQRLEAQPSIDAASASSAFPGGGVDPMTFTIVGDPIPDPASKPHSFGIAVSPDYFRTMGIRLLRGRGLLPIDDRRARRVAVVDADLARRFFGGDPVGRRIVGGWLTAPGTDTMEIVGVVAHVRQSGPTDEDQPGLYVPFAQFPDNSAGLEVHTTGEPDAQVATLRRVVAAVDPTAPVYDVQTLTERMAQAIGTTRFAALLASLFAAVALVLGAIGIYSVLAYVVSQRQREIAVRIAIGAKGSQMMADVVRRALRLTVIGVLLGSGAAWVLTRVLAGLFEGVSPHDPVIFLGAAAAFTVVALAAAGVPAFRTTRVNPVTVLTST